MRRFLDAMAKNSKNVEKSQRTGKKIYILI